MIFAKVLLMLAPSLLAAFVHQKVNGKKFKLWQFSKTFLCYAAVINVFEIWLIAVRGYNKYFSFATMKDSLVAKYIVLGVSLAFTLPVLLFYVKKISKYRYASDQLFTYEDTALKRCILFVVVFIYVITLFFLCRTYYGYWEVDSYALPVISIQYRGDLLMCQDDLFFARRDFPTLYASVFSYGNLRSAMLLKTSTGMWEAHYFPIYAILVLPFKLFLQFFEFNQEFCFIIFNCACLLLLFFTIIINQKLSFNQKFVLTVLLMCSPIYYYIRYISAETMIYCFVGIGMLHFYERNYKRAAVFITLAGMTNSAVMAIGIVLIADWFVFVIKKKKGISFMPWLKKEFPGAIVLALCFVPSLFPFILRAKTGVGQFYSGVVTQIKTSIINNASVPAATEVVQQQVSAPQQITIPTNTYLGRIFEYIFGLARGLPTFAPFLIFLFFIFIIIGIIKKRYRDNFIFLFSLLGIVAAYSGMPHINSGFTYCARYVYWTYPILAIFFGTTVYDLFVQKKLYLCTISFSTVVSVFLLFFNNPTANAYSFNPSAALLMDFAPALYNPLPSTFKCNVNHVDGGYKIDQPIIYKRHNGTIAKILATSADVDTLLQSIYRNDKDGIWFEKKLHELKHDKYTYINVPRSRHLYINIYKMGTVINWWELSKYASSGISTPESKYIWTDGKEFRSVFILDEIPMNKIHGTIELLNVFNGSQTVNVFVNGENVLNDVIVDGQNVEFDCDPPEQDFLDIRILLPDSMAPSKLHINGDNRKLALAIRSIQLSEISHDLNSKHP